MPKQRVISPVETMQEKYETYRAEMARLKVALQQGFYFEAMLIEYALLEDRLRSFVYHAGLLQNRKASHLLPGKNAVRKDFNRIAQRVKTWKLEDGKETENTSNFERLSVNKISIKFLLFALLCYGAVSWKVCRMKAATCRRSVVNVKALMPLHCWKRLMPSTLGECIAMK